MYFEIGRREEGESSNKILQTFRKDEQRIFYHSMSFREFWIEILNFKAQSYHDILRINGSGGEKRENYRIKFYKRFEKS